MDERINEVISYSGKPYFIFDSRKGFFLALKDIVFSDSIGMFRHNADIGDLVLDEDIEEIPSFGGINLCVVSDYEDFPLRNIIHDLRQYARDKEQDFVSCDIFGNSLGLNIGCRNGLNFFLVSPRLFKRKI